MQILAQQSGEQQGAVQQSEDQEIPETYPKPGRIRSFFNSRYEAKNSDRYEGSFYDSFLKEMAWVKSKKTEELYPPECYTAMGMPAPDQYSAFYDLYSVSSKDYFDNHKKGIYNAARLSLQPITLKMIKETYDNFEKDPVKKIKIVCGSFWRKNLWMRHEIIHCLNLLNTRYKAEVEIINNCGIDEDFGISALNSGIDFKRKAERVLIHYILFDDKKLYLEFPHSEKHYLRLYMMLTSDDLNSPGFNKQAVLTFLEGLVRKAKDRQ